MPTLIGVFFFIVGAYYFLAEEDGLLGLLLVASIFQAASAINVAERGIQPSFLIEGFIILRALRNHLSAKRIVPKMPNGRWLFAFAVISSGSALFLPVLFAGLPIYDPKVGIDDGLLIRPPLSLGLNNAVQASFLVWHIATVYAVRWLKFSATKTRKAFLFAFYLALFFIGLQSFCHHVGITYPDSVIRNNPGYDISDMTIETRYSGTFAEPSFAGAFLSFCCVVFMVDYLEGKRSALRFVMAFVASGVVSSSGSLLTITIFACLLLVKSSPFRHFWYINIPRLKRVAWLFFLLTAPLMLVLAISPEYRDSLTGATVAKGDTGSFIDRTASDLYALELLRRTYGLGVGMGSNRASSLLTSLLSNVGVAGCLAFAVFFWRLFRDVNKTTPSIAWAVWALLLNMMVEIPDVTFPILWVIIALGLSIQLHVSAEISGPWSKVVGYGSGISIAQVRLDNPSESK